MAGRQSVAVELPKVEPAVALSAADTQYQEEIKASIGKKDEKKTMMLIERYKKVGHPNPEFWTKLTEKLEEMQVADELKDRIYASAMLDYLRGLNDYDEGDEPENKDNNDEKKEDGENEGDGEAEEEEEEKEEEEEQPWKCVVHVVVEEASQETVSGDGQLQFFPSASCLVFHSVPPEGADPATHKSSPPFPIKHYIHTDSNEPLQPGQDPKLQVIWNEVDVSGSETDRKFRLTFKNNAELEEFRKKYLEVASQLRPVVASNRRASQVPQNAFVVPKRALKYGIVAKAVQVPTCTFRINPDYVRQPFWRCLTCNPEDFVCIVCVHHCHRGHNVEFDRDFSDVRAFCDCGGASADCKARKHEDDSVPDIPPKQLREHISELQDEVVRNTTLRTGRGEFFFWDSLLFYLSATVNRAFCARLQAALDSEATKTDAKNAIYCFRQALKEAHSLWKAKNDKSGTVVVSEFIDSEARVTASLVGLLDLFEEQPKVWDYSYFQYHVKPPAKRYLPFPTSYGVPLQGGRSEDIVFWRRFFQDAQRISVARLSDALFCHICIVESQPLDYDTFGELVQEVGFPNQTGVDYHGWCKFLQKFGPTLNVVYTHLTGCATFIGQRSDWLQLPTEKRDESDPAKVRMEDSKFVLLGEGGKEEEILLNVEGYYIESSPGSFSTVRELVSKQHTDFRLRFEIESWKTKIDPSDRVVVEDKLDSFVNQSEKVYSRVLLIEKDLSTRQEMTEFDNEFWPELQKRWKETPFFGLKSRPAKIPKDVVLELLEAAIKVDSLELAEEMSPKLEALFLAVWELPSEQRTFMGCMDSLDTLANLRSASYDDSDWFSKFLDNVAITTMRGVYQHIKRADREWLDNFDQICKGFGKMCNTHVRFRQLAAKYPLLSAIVLATKNEVIEHWPLIKVASIVRGVREMVDYTDDTEAPDVTETGIAVLVDHGVLRSFVNSVKFHRWLAKDTWPLLLQTLTNEVLKLVSLALHSQYRSLLLIDNGQWFFPFLLSITTDAPDPVMRNYFPVLLFVDNIDVAELDDADQDAIRNHVKELRKIYAGVKEILKDALTLDLRQYKVVDVYYEPQGKLVPCVFQHDEAVSKNSTFLEQSKKIPFKVDPSKGGELRQSNVIEPLVHASDMYCHQFRLNRGTGLVRIVADYDQVWSTTTIFLICALNALAVATIHKDKDEPAQIAKLARLAMYVLGAAHVGFAFLMLCAYFLDFFGYRETVVERQYYTDKPDDEKKLSSWQKFRKRLQESSMYWQVLAYKGFAAQLFYFGFSIVGLIWPFGYCFALVLAIFLFTKTAEELLEAIGLAAIRVLGAIMLGVTVIYFFAVIAYLGSFNSGYQFSDGPVKWDTLIWTVLGHFDLGLRSAPVFDYTSPGASRTFGQFFFAFTYYFLVVLVLVAIMGGIIVDAFGQIRSRLESQNDALDSTCLVCGVSLTEAKFKFKDHVHTRHSYNNYIDLFSVVTLSFEYFAGENNGVWHQPFQRMLEYAVSYGEPEGNILPSWNLHSDQLNSDRLMLNLKDERETIQGTRDEPRWDVALPIKFK